MSKYDVAVIGGGPAGYVAAIKAAQLGGKVAIIEKDKFGGTCLNRGCISARTFLHSAEILETARKSQSRGVMGSENLYADIDKIIDAKNEVAKILSTGVEGLIKSNQITLIRGNGEYKNGKVFADGEEIGECSNVILCGGSSPLIPNIPGVSDPMVMSSDELLDYLEIPERLCIIGGGVIGVEFAQAYSAFGSLVTVIEGTERILPAMDKEISDAVAKRMKRSSIQVVTGQTVKQIKRISEDLLSVETDDGNEFCADVVLLAIGRKPDLSSLKDSSVEIENGAIKVDGNLRTSVNNVFAAGDITGINMLAHAAMYMGKIAAENAMGNSIDAEFDLIPSCVHGFIEGASIGLTESQAIEEYHEEIKVGRFPIMGNGRALAEDCAEGFVKIIAAKKFSEILGVQIVGPNATEMINNFAGLIKMEVTTEDFDSFVYAHPCFSEAVWEAVADSDGKSIHLPCKYLRK